MAKSTLEEGFTLTVVGKWKKARWYKRGGVGSGLWSKRYNRQEQGT